MKKQNSPAAPADLAEAPAPAIAMTAVEAPKAEAKRPAVKVDLSRYASKMPEAAKKTKYWIGVTPECPRKPVHLAGQDFPFIVTPPRDAGDGTSNRETSFGQVVALTDEHVEAIKEAVAKKVVRWNNTRGRGWLLDRTHSAFAPDIHDEPLAKYVYMIAVEEYMPTDFRRRPSTETMA